MEKRREQRRRRGLAVCCLAVFLAGSGLWLGIKGCGIAGAAADDGAGLRELQGIRWEKELFCSRNEDFWEYLYDHQLPVGYMDDDEKDRFGIYGDIWGYQEGMALGYDLPSSTWYCFDEAGKTVFTIKTDFPAMEVPGGGVPLAFQDGLAALPLSSNSACVVDRRGRRVILEFPGSIYICRDQKVLFVYSGGTGWTWGIARLGEGKLKGV